MHKAWEGFWSSLLLACMASTVSGLVTVCLPPFWEIDGVSATETEKRILKCMGPAAFNLGWFIMTVLLILFVGAMDFSYDFAGTGHIKMLAACLMALTAALLHSVWPLLIVRCVHLIGGCSLRRGDEVSSESDEVSSESDE